MHEGEAHGPAWGMKELGDESVFWEEGTVCAKAWKQSLSGGRLKELSTVTVGRRKGTGTVLPAGWSLEAGPEGPAEGSDFVLSTRDP